MTWGKTYWPWFLIIGSLFFLIPEAIALVTRHANTLSYYARTELNVSRIMTVHTAAWWLSLTAWGLFVFVITLHIWFDLLG